MYHIKHPLFVCWSQLKHCFIHQVFFYEFSNILLASGTFSIIKWFRTMYMSFYCLSYFNFASFPFPVYTYTFSLLFLRILLIFWWHCNDALDLPCTMSFLTSINLATSEEKKKKRIRKTQSMLGVLRFFVNREQV